VVVVAAAAVARTALASFFLVDFFNCGPAPAKMLVVVVVVVVDIFLVLCFWLVGGWVGGRG